MYFQKYVKQKVLFLLEKSYKTRDTKEKIKLNDLKLGTFKIKEKNGRFLNILINFLCNITNIFSFLVTVKVHLKNYPVQNFVQKL